jgi:hypothetical protein
MLHLTSSHAIDPSPRSQAINNGTISVISSDHSPAPPEDKKLEEGDFLKAWGGIAGLQFSLPATWTSASKRNVPLVALSGAFPVLHLARHDVYLPRPRFFFLCSLSSSVGTSPPAREGTGAAG